MTYTYPLLEKVFSHLEKASNAPQFYLVCCQHLLDAQLKMFEHLIGFGFDPKKIIVLGKAYSSNKEIISALSDLGITVVQPEFTGSSFDSEHKNNCKKIVELIPDDTSSIILDDGAELIKAFVESKKKVLFAVEQTSSGFRKLEKESLPFPVVNVARSSTKLVQESPLIARLCFERIKSYLSEKQIFKPSILVVGLGPIGEAILQVFKLSDFTVEGFDTKLGHDNLPAFIQKMKPDVIIGATGFNILEKRDIDTLLSEKRTYLISVSSSDREFPVAEFRKDRKIHNDVTYKNITFVNNGFPITFKGNRSELTPFEIEKTICLLGGSIAYGSIHPFKGTGITNVPIELENLINS